MISIASAMECFKSCRRGRVVPGNELISDQAEDTPQTSPRAWEEEEGRGEGDRPLFTAQHPSGQEEETTSPAKQESQSSGEQVTILCQGEDVTDPMALAQEESQASGGHDTALPLGKVASACTAPAQRKTKRHSTGYGYSCLSPSPPKHPDSESHLYTALSIGAPTSGSSSSSDDDASPPHQEPTDSTSRERPRSSDPDYKDYTYILEAYGVIPPRGVKPVSPPRKTENEKLLEEYLFKRTRKPPKPQYRDWMEILQEQVEANQQKKDELKAYRAKMARQEEGLSIDAEVGGAHSSGSSSSWGKEGLEGVPVVLETTLSVAGLSPVEPLTMADISQCLRKKARITVNVEVPRMDPELSEGSSGVGSGEEEDKHASSSEETVAGGGGGVAACCPGGVVKTSEVLTERERKTCSDGASASRSKSTDQL